MDVVIAILGSGALSALIAGVFNLINDRRERVDKRFQILERDNLRTQMLLMLKDFPEEKTEILKIAERYFAKLNGNWYMTSMFNKWLEENDVAKPEWFKD